MNILYLVKHFPCLSQTFVINEVAALTRRGCAVHVVSAIDLHEPIALDPLLAARVTYLRHGYLYQYRNTLDDAPTSAAIEDALASEDASVSIDERRRLWRILGEHEADAASRARGLLDALQVLALVRAKRITHLHCDFAEDNVTLAYIVHLVTGIPFSFKMRAYDIFAEPPRELAKWAAAAERVLTISEYNRAYICRQWGLAPEKVTVIYDGVDPEATMPIARYAHRPFTIVSVSRLVEKKGFGVLLEACRLLGGRVEFQCDIFGDGPMRAALQDRVAELGLEGRVTLHGARSHGDVLAALEVASVFVLACVQARNGDRDATPNALLEAMARGVPVISTRLSGIPEMVENEIDGILVPANDAQALADAVARIANDRGLAETMRGAAQRTVTKRFLIDRNADEFLRLLDRSGECSSGRLEAELR